MLGMHVMRFTYQLVVMLAETPKNTPEANATNAETKGQPIHAQSAQASAAFYRIARFVRDTIKLHVSLAAGEIPPLPRPSLPRPSVPRTSLPRPSLPRTSLPHANRQHDAHQNETPAHQTPAPAMPAPKEADPRFEPVAAYLVSAIKSAPRGRCKPNAAEKIPIRLRDTILADPGHTLTGAQIAVKICKEFHLPYNIAKLNQDPTLSHNPNKPAQGTGPPSVM